MEQGKDAARDYAVRAVDDNRAFAVIRNGESKGFVRRHGKLKNKIGVLFQRLAPLSESVSDIVEFRLLLNRYAQARPELRCQSFRIIRKACFSLDC
jgi:hypothetical protein